MLPDVSHVLRGVAAEVGETVGDVLPGRMRENLLLKAFGLTKIPMIAFAGPRVHTIEENRCVIEIPLNFRTRNHLKVMYIGVLTAGADLAGGLLAMRRIRESGEQVNLLFKDFQANFLKRVDGDCHFTCTDGPAIDAMVREAVETGERVNAPLNVIATVPSRFGDEPVAEFRLTLTLKKRRR